MSRVQKVYVIGEQVGKFGIEFITEIEPRLRENGKKLRQATFKCKCGQEFNAEITRISTNEIRSCGCAKQGEEKTQYTNEFIDSCGIYYETNDKPLAEVAKLYGVNYNTFNSWAKKNGWQQARLMYAQEQIKNTMEQNLEKALEQTLTPEQQQEAANLAGSDQKGDKLIKNTALKLLNAEFFAECAKVGIEKGKELLKKSNRMSDVVGFMSVVATGKDVIYGKGINTLNVFQTGEAALTKQEMASMTTEQLLALVKSEDKPIDAEVLHGKSDN